MQRECYLREYFRHLCTDCTADFYIVVVGSEGGKGRGSTFLI
jgi:hypothetical protein